MGAINNEILAGEATEPPLDFRALPSFRLHRLARLMEREAEAEYLRLFGLRLVECRILGLAGAPGGTTLKQLTDELDLDKAHCSRLVARLVVRGLVGRGANPADARSASLRATPQGQLLRADIHAAARARNATLLGVLPEPAAAAFLTSLDRLAAGLRGLLPAPAAVPPAALSEAVPQPSTPAAQLPPKAAPGAPIPLDRALAHALHHALTAALEPPP